MISAYVSEQNFDKCNFKCIRERCVEYISPSAADTSHISVWWKHNPSIAQVLHIHYYLWLLPILVWSRSAPYDYVYQRLSCLRTSIIPIRPITFLLLKTLTFVHANLPHVLHKYGRGFAFPRILEDCTRNGSQIGASDESRNDFAEYRFQAMCDSKHIWLDWADRRKRNWL